jgi:hypothetical protein
LIRINISERGTTGAIFSFFVATTGLTLLRRFSVGLNDLRFVGSNSLARSVLNNAALVSNGRSTSEASSRTDRHGWRGGDSEVLVECYFIWCLKVNAKVYFVY